jgi:hypothetical protein
MYPAGKGGLRKVWCVWFPRYEVRRSPFSCETWYPAGCMIDGTRRCSRRVRVTWWRSDTLCRGGAEDLFVGFPGAAFDIVRRGSLFGEPMIVRLAIHADGTVTLTDILAEMRERDAFSRW